MCLGDAVVVGHEAAAGYEPRRAFLGLAVHGVEIAQHARAIAGIRLVHAPGQELGAPGHAFAGVPIAVLALVLLRAFGIAQFFLRDLDYQHPGLRALYLVRIDHRRLPGLGGRQHAVFRQDGRLGEGIGSGRGFRFFAAGGCAA